MANEVKITITGKDGVSQTFVAVGRSADQMATRVDQASAKSERSLKKWNDAAFKVGSAMGALALITSKVAGDAEASNARLETSFANAGLAVDDYRVQLDRLTDTGLKLAFDDEDVQDSIASLVDVTGNAEDAFRDLAIAQDVARARQIDLASATRLVIAAETGRFQSLQRMGIAIDSTMTSEEALAALQGKYAGQAEAYAETTAASYERMGNTIENALEGIGDVANKALLPILAISTAAPAIGSVASAIGGLAGGTAGLAALGTALAGVGLASAALAAPVGIATYLFLDQKNVVARATEETLKNKQVLEEYVAYLESIETPAEFIPEMTQDMKELVDWVTKVGDGVDTGLLQIGLSVSAFSTNVGALDDAIRNLNPENLESVKQLAKDLGIVFTDPNTWTPDAINTLSNYIVNLNNNQQMGTLVAAEYSMAQAEASATIKNLTVVTDFYLQSLTQQNTVMAASEDTWLQNRENAVGFARGLGEVSAASVTAGKDLSYLTDQLDALAASLKDATPATTLDRVFRAIVGNTNAMVGSIDTAKKWADELIAPVGTYSAIDTLLKDNKISIDEYNAAQQAQIGITEDYNRALEASQVIQTKQAPLIADQTEATADYLEKLSQQTAQEQQVALAWADTDYATRATDIVNMAASYDTMTDSQKKAFEDLITNAAAADPVLASLLEDLGIITTTDGEIKINYDALGGADDAMGDLIDSLNTLIDLLAEKYGVDIDYTDASETSGLLGAIATQMNELDGKTATVYVNRTVIGFTEDIDRATGGMLSFAKGGMVRLAEMGPEMLQFANGGMAIAPRDGVYQVPDNTYVSTAATTNDRVRGAGGNRVNYINNVNLYPATPDLQANLLNDALFQGVLR